MGGGDPRNGDRRPGLAFCGPDSFFPERGLNGFGFWFGGDDPRDHGFEGVEVRDVKGGWGEACIDGPHGASARGLFGRGEGGAKEEVAAFLVPKAHEKVGRFVGEEFERQNQGRNQRVGFFVGKVGHELGVIHQSMNPTTTERCYVVLRTDRDGSVTVKLIAWSVFDADAHVTRLNALNEARGCLYRWEMSRALRRGARLIS